MLFLADEMELGLGSPTGPIAPRHMIEMLGERGQWFHGSRRAGIEISGCR